MTKAVLEAGSEDEARQTAAAMPSPALAVPASLHASLMARLDRLGPAKEMAQGRMRNPGQDDDRMLSVARLVAQSAGGFRLQ